MVLMPPPLESLKRKELPAGPWQHISADLMTPSLPLTDHLFVVVDYMEVKVLKFTATDKIVRNLKSMFLTHGLPVSITTDNRPQFISQEFQRFVEDECIDHRRVTPLWPQANGEVERQNRSLLKRIKIAQIEKKDWRKEIESFLVMHKTTPQSATGVRLTERMFRWKLRTRIPGIEEFQVDDQKSRDRDKEAKERGKLYADEKRDALESESDVKEGDRVLLKQEQTNKLTLTFRPEPFRVLEKTRNSVVVESPEGVQYKRNSTQVKKFVERDGLPEGDPPPHADDKYLKETVEPVFSS